MSSSDSWPSWLSVASRLWFERAATTRARSTASRLMRPDATRWSMTSRRWSMSGLHQPELRHDDQADYQTTGDQRGPEGDGTVAAAPDGDLHQAEHAGHDQGHRHVGAKPQRQST